jgi:hypothetical protein
MLAAAVAFFVLLQMAVFGTWLEVVRLTALAWVLLAIGTKEFHARTRRPAPPATTAPARVWQPQNGRPAR